MAYDHPLPVEEHQDHFLRILVFPTSLDSLVLKTPREMVVDRVVVFGGTPGSSAIRLSWDEDQIQDSGSTYIVGSDSSGVNASASGESLEIDNNVIPEDRYLMISGGGQVTCDIWMRSKRK